MDPVYCFKMSFLLKTYENLLAELVPSCGSTEPRICGHLVGRAAAVGLRICVRSRWPVLSVHQLQACFVPVQRPEPPRAKPPCDPRQRGVTDRSSPYYRTCDRRCG